MNGSDPDRDVSSTLSGAFADRDRTVACSTRRVVMTSLGVMKQQKAGRKRVRAVALAAMICILLALAPLIWWAAEYLFSGEHLGDLTCQFNLWVCILCPALLAAAVVAGWLRHRS